MRHAYSYLLALALLAPAAALAQQPWQPFRPGLTYQFSESATPGDTTHTLQVGAGVRIPGTTDSVFRFNGRAVRIAQRPNACGFGQLRADNLFGATLRTQGRGVFVLAAANGRTLTLRPRTALGSSWAAGPANLTARVVGRGVAPVLGGAPDSVATIVFSDGQTLQLSKHYGVLASPSLDSYLNGRNRRRALTLTALPERRLGTAATGARVVYDFQPGDVFQYYSRSYTIGRTLCTQRWQQDSVLTRTVSRTGDSVTYTWRTRQRSQGYGFPGAPGQFCSAAPGITFGTYTYPQVVAENMPYSNARLLTGFYYPQRALTGVAVRSSRYFGRPETEQIITVSSCTPSAADSVFITGVVDYGAMTRTAVGLGLTFRQTVSMGTNVDTTELTGYRKGSQLWGTMLAPRFFLAARDVRPAPTTTAFPNPFATTLTATFALARPQAVAAELHDALGRTVRQVPAVTFAAGAGRLELPTAGLPAGVYTLHLKLLGEGRTEVLKVVRGE